ncbi:MAG: CDP-alcohol phosphatidyltransferase family protein [Clostridia bacterium]|nr:CDP-alcohol phosphatidyltransferase family protein [Clostridia bacterium]
MANIITGLRIACSTAILFCEPLSAAFYVLYSVAGFTDMIDGAVARKTNKASDSGAVFDTAADAALVAACLVKLLPVLNIPVWIYVWCGVIALVKVINVISGLVLRKKIVVLHTVMNKVTGILLFALPFTISLVDPVYSAPLVCAAATFAAVQEGHFIRSGKGGREQK